MQKGFFLAFVIFLIATTIILAGLGVKQTETRQKQSTVEETAFETVNNAFTNIYNETLAVKTGYAGRLQSRILTPFEYDAGNMACKDECVQPDCGINDDHDICPCTGPNASPNGCGWIEISQETPVPDNDEQLKETYDALNLYSIFVSSKNINGDLNITASAIKNNDWCPSCAASCGGCKKLSYLVLDECVLYDPQPLDPNPPSNKLRVFTDGSGNGCTFALDKIRAIDFNVVVNETLDIKSNSGGIGDLADNQVHSFLQGNSNPYVKISLSVPNCTPKTGICNYHCCIDRYETPPVYDNGTIIANHVNVSNGNGYEIQLETGSPIRFGILHQTYLNETPKTIIMIDNGSSQRAPVETTTKIIFNEPINIIKFNAFDFNVGKTGFTNLKIGTS